ncbi:alpha-N-arabinofuranosidase A [Colletotrichum lupini]|uniref:non-reducing end alpha-L-arabinofuranosidase n=1 Tax=Colletotrichum lupini TaxID=145971 RepID=A0A9Q8SL70_9PEZI|nr:alpha-N-arabinofuranosidase A [Colletotrichum lupini]UQC79258.1 alpha-N-arabinofuranosidase A [Colletotrichum lupini]
MMAMSNNDASHFSFNPVAFFLLVIGTPIATVAGALLLQVDTGSPGHELSPLLHGLMFEDISNSGDGGLYSQQLRNNAFQGGVTTVDPWTVHYGAAEISHDTQTPLTNAITSSLKITIPTGAGGFTGVANPGYRGIIVNGGYYDTTFWLRGDFQGDVKIRLLSNETDVEHGWAIITVDSKADSWTRYEAGFWTTAAADGNNLWVFEILAEALTSGSINLGYPTLFPPTFRGRENGLTVDLSEALVNLKPQFLRFPGGNNLEGGGPHDRWKWNETIGTWGYVNTDGLGLMEYFQWCEDMSLEPILDVWAGLGLAGLPPLVGDELEPYVEDAIREIEFVIGDIDTSGGALRATLGHPEPYQLNFVEVGNEDNLAGGCESYKQRFVQFFDAIKEAYPQITVLTSTSDRACLPDPIPEGAWLDFHDYNVPENYINAYDFYDDWDRAHPVFIGEYARWGVKWSDMRGAYSEAVYMMGWERNADVIKLAAYAPTLQNYDPVNGQWTPNLIPFTNKPDGIVYTPSYHVKRMFANNHGDVVVPVTADAELNPVWWAASMKGEGQVIVKLANYASNSTEIRIQIPGKADVKGSFTSITASPDNANSVENPTLVSAPAVLEVSADPHGVFTIELGQFGVGVLAA